MSVKVIPHINKVVNSNNQIIYKFPANTLLDNILPDLWLKIIEYHNHHKTFAFGAESVFSNYRLVTERKNSNYRLVTLEELETDSFRKLFSDCYFGYKGLHCLENTRLQKNPIIHVHDIDNALMIKRNETIEQWKGPKYISLKLEYTGDVKDNFPPFQENTFVPFLDNAFTETEIKKMVCMRQCFFGNFALLFIKKGIYLY